MELEEKVKMRERQYQEYNEHLKRKLAEEKENMSNNNINPGPTEISNVYSSNGPYDNYGQTYGNPYSHYNQQQTMPVN